MADEEYQQGGRASYLDFVVAVQNILRHTLGQHEMAAHSLTGRARELADVAGGWAPLANLNLTKHQASEWRPKFNGHRQVWLVPDRLLYDRSVADGDEAGHEAT